MSVGFMLSLSCHKVYGLIILHCLYDHCLAIEKRSAKLSQIDSLRRIARDVGAISTISPAYASAPTNILLIFCLLLRVPRFDRDLRIKVKNELHRLRVPERVTYRLCTLVYKSLHGLASGYLAELGIPVARDSYRRNLRSADKNELQVTRHKLSTYGPRSYSIAVPSAWKSLPQHVRDDKLYPQQFLRGRDTLILCVV